MDEGELVSAARRGSTDAFCELVGRHEARVRAFIARHVRAPDMVDDLAQEVFLGALRGLEGFRGDSTLLTWLLGIARKRVLDHLRAEVRRRAREPDGLDRALAAWQLEAAEAEAAEPAPAGGRGDPRADRIDALKSCLERLARAEAELVTSYYWNGQTSAEIARRTVRTDTSVRMALSRIRRKLLGCIQKRVVWEAT
jgi:RNA polymerase sigma-70 factor (ECF subfamily)